MFDIYKIFFIDIETVPQTATLSELSEELQNLWADKFYQLQRRTPDKYGENTTAEEGYLKNAGIYSEFGRIICISIGFIAQRQGKKVFRIKSFAEDDEKTLLQKFSELIVNSFKIAEYNFCGHNIKEFDIPYICRRMLVNGLQLPEPLQINAKKPWEVNLLDTLDYWKFGDYKNYVSLKLLTAIFEIPTPKDDINGSMVAEVYYHEKNLERIVTYCQKDVFATAQVWLKMNGLAMLDSENVEYVE
ncbi:MAG TPA: 3'-5' exonuclease [Bacteroidales bacterium]|nr:3'-5' exonuclease [Bacteroidales bacterium]